LYANEDVVGEAIADALTSGVITREELFITSKLPPTHMQADTAEEALDATLAALQTPYLDLYLLHWPTAYVKTPSAWPVPLPERLGYDAARTLAVWRVLERAVKAGKIRSLGCSNFTITQLQTLLDAGLQAPVCCNQLEVHPYLAQKEMLRWHAERGIVVTCYSPLASPARPPTCHFEEDPTPLLSHPIVCAVAARAGMTAAQACIVWALQRGTVPLPKSVTGERIRENTSAALGKAGSLDAEAMAALNSLDLHYRFVRGDNHAPEGMFWWEMWGEEAPRGGGCRLLSQQVAVLDTAQGPWRGKSAEEVAALPTVASGIRFGYTLV
jgi:alcohol dehydrogenase (NADP+)